MRILLTNDDGIDSQGLSALENALADHEIWVVAPDGERSGGSHAIQMRGPVKLSRRGNRRFACSGSPADCVFLAFRGSLVPAFDAVVSGINHGPNLGTDLIYSGTAAAARQASLLGVPGVALSLDVQSAPWDFSHGAEFVRQNLEDWVADWTPGTFLNVNFPSRPLLPLEAEWAVPSERRYYDQVVEFEAPGGEVWCWVKGLILDDAIAEGSDWAAVRRGKVSCTVVVSHPVALGERSERRTSP
ncbi:MAG: 5'/3'-nucleotidase SurE [Spirochaetales bacterium]|nr:5'/3'-nucleotidase SurE [Spirochaetales bacterium]